jgi:autotransporter-associated beta strand protein
MKTTEMMAEGEVLHAAKHYPVPNGRMGGVGAKLTRRVVASLIALGLLPASVLAADGIWVGRGAQPYGQAIWGGVANWVNSTVASGTGYTAYFGQSFVNGYRCIVNTARTIGHIVYNDPDDANDFILAKHANDYALTLDVTSGMPDINVTQSNRTVTVEVRIAGNDGLAKNGPGTLVLTRANTYTGGTAVNAGTLKVWTGGAIGAPVTVANGATLGVVVTTDNGQLVVTGDWTHGSGSTLLIDYGTTTPSAGVAPLQVGNLSLGRNLTLRITIDSWAKFASGQAYPLISWTGSGPADATAFSVVVLPFRFSYELVVFENTLYLDVIHNAAGPISWNTGDGTWDTVSPNWLDATWTPTTYCDGLDAVLFNDAPDVQGSPTVTLRTPVSPVSVTIRSGARDYTLKGAGRIEGVGSVVLDAANTGTLSLAVVNASSGETRVYGGTLVLAASNTYAGNTVVTGGVVRLGAAEVIPDGPGKGNVIVEAGGLLDLNGFSETINGLAGSGVVDNLAGGTVTLTVGGNNVSSGFMGVIQNSAGTLNLVKTGTGVLNLSGANTFNGTVTIAGGTLGLGHRDAISSVSAITIAGGAALTPNLNGMVINAPISLGASGTTSRINAPLENVGGGVVSTLTLNQPISGDGNLAFYGINQLNAFGTIILNAQSTYAGSTLISCDPNQNAGLNCFVKLGIQNALPPSTELTLDGLDGGGSGRVVQLDLNGYDQILGGLSSVPRALLRRQQIVNTDSSRPATLTVSNTIDCTFMGELGPVEGANNIALVKDGPGKFTLNPSTTNAQGQILNNYYTGPTTVQNGILEIGPNGQLGGGEYAADIWVEAGAALVFNSSLNTRLLGMVSGQGSLTNEGRGTLTICSWNELPNTVVAPGSRLAINNGAVEVVTVQTGGTLSLPWLGWVGRLTFTDTGTLEFDVAGGGMLDVGYPDGVINGGGPGSITINITGIPPMPGVYTLITYSGRLLGSGFSAYRIGTTPSAATYRLIDAPGQVQLSVEPALTWTGAESSEWSLNPIGGLKNWALLGNPADYTDGVGVVFDDTVGTGSTTVDISVVDVMPQGVWFDNSTYNYTLQGTKGIVGPTGLIKSGSGTLTILNNNAYTGPTEIRQGVVQVGNGGTTGSLGSGPILNDSTLQFNRSDTLTVASPISGAGALEQNGPGILVLSGANSYSGDTRINVGTVRLGTGDVLPDGLGKGNILVNGTLDLNGLSEIVNGLTGSGTVDTLAGGPATLTVGGNNASSTFNGLIQNSSGSLTLVKIGSGTLTLAGANRYSGGTLINGGIVRASHATALGSGAVTINGGTRLVVDTGLDLANPIVIGTNVGVAGRGLVEAGTAQGMAVIRGPIQITRSASAGGHFAAPTANTILHVAGPITAPASVEVVSRAGTVMFSGGGTGYSQFAIGAGTVLVGAEDGLATTARVRIGVSAAGALDLNGFDQSLVAIEGTGANATVINNSVSTDSTLTLTGVSVYDGTIRDNVDGGKVHLRVLGGQLTLTGANTYRGDTLIEAGTLLVNNSSGSGTGSGMVNISSGGTLGGRGIVTGTVTVNSGGNLSPGVGVGRLTTGSQIWNGGGAYSFELSSCTNSAGWDLLTINGTLGVQATPANQFRIKLVSMEDTANAGPLPDFDPSTNYTWVIATATDGIVNFDASKFQVDTSRFSNAYNGTFTVAVEGNSVAVKYEPSAPQPAIVGFGVVSKTSFSLTFSGPSGQTYKVLSSTNVALPLSLWRVLASGTFGANPVTYLDTSATNAQQFYCIQSP